MSELIQKHDNRATIRWKLLTGASALALTAYAASVTIANASDTDRPVIWLEAGGEFTQLLNSEEPYLPPFVEGTRLPFITQSPDGIEKNSRHSLDTDAQISFQPKGSDWIFSARIQYGRTAKKKALSERTAYPSTSYYFFRYEAYQNILVQNTETHAIVDFTAGKDIGLGMFGSGVSSVASIGVRYAHLGSKSKIGIQYQPTNAVYTYHRFYGSLAAKRDFTGVGPSISWDASATIAGNSSDSSISLDWGVNGAVLFGRQRANIHHQTTNLAVGYPEGSNRHPVYEHPASPSRDKQIVVPNLGAFAGVSWRYAAAKVTLGYRADYFFGVLDGGIDTAKKEDRAFYGPFASVSIGIGD
ncbi:MAG TPA: Lpg1974 family pore-forming outer membrane protein [Rhizomicrobium sp.]|nr:Lpg1974 family pore-forming outer membrane protein [Rhizomicrobium sp.]